MTTTAGELVQSAFYYANILDPGEEILGFQAAGGLLALNAIIDQWSGTSIYIPTYTISTIMTSPAVYSYTITPPITQLLESNLIDPNNVQWPLRQIDLKRYNLLNIPLSTQAPCRPNLIFLQDDAAVIGVSTTVILFPVPDQIYTVTLRAKQYLTPFLLTDTILEIPPFGLKSLKFQLSRDLSIEYGSKLDEKFESEYLRTMRMLRASNKRDSTVINSNPYNTGWRRFRPWSGYYG
jgi:hypothetical protein